MMSNPPMLLVAQQSIGSTAIALHCSRRTRVVCMLEKFGPSLYSADGPTVSFFGFPYPTRMAVARLSDGGVWVWSPIALTEELADEVQAIGPVRHIVSPNKIHHLFLGEWASHWPDARLYAPPGLAQRKPEIPFDDELDDEPPASWAADIDQVVFRGSFAMEEVVFFHRVSRTAIVGDLIQRHLESKMSGWKGALMRFDGLVGDRGSTPREWQATFFQRSSTRAARKAVLEWNAERLLIAHGKCAQTGAAEILSTALSWI
ncbi:MAG: DUF4336 domain-containing protein [Limnospira sp.]